MHLHCIAVGRWQKPALEPQPPQRIFAAESAAIASASMLTAPCLPAGLAMLPFIASKFRSLPYLSIHCLSILSFQPHSQAACKAWQLHIFFYKEQFASLLLECTQAGRPQDSSHSAKR